MDGDSPIHEIFYSDGFFPCGVFSALYSSSSSSAGGRQGTTKQSKEVQRSTRSLIKYHNDKKQHKALVEFVDQKCGCSGSKKSVTYSSTTKVYDEHRGLTTEYSTQVKHKKVTYPTPKKKIKASPKPTKVTKTTYFKY